MKTCNKQLKIFEHQTNLQNFHHCATTASTTSFVGQVLNRTFDLCASMIPEPNLWADLRDRDRGLDEVEYPPHHLEVAPSNTRWGISLNFVPPKEQIKHVF